MDEVKDEWPVQAIPVTEGEIGEAVALLRRRDSWTRGFTVAALLDAVEPLFKVGWCPAALRQALLVGPGGERYETPALMVEDVLARWRAWHVPPLRGHELGVTLVAQFGRDSSHKIRESWAARAVPQNPVQAFLAVRWIRLTFGWSTRATLMDLVRLLTPWFVRGWCPDAVRWAVEHFPDGRSYGSLPATLDQITNRLAKWERRARENLPPVEGAPWEKIAEVRQERITRDRVNDEALLRWSERTTDRYEYWRYKRSVPGKHEQDDRTDACLRSLVPAPVHMTGPDPVAPVADDGLCDCQNYWRLPGQRWCTVCARTRGYRVTSVRRRNHR